MSVTQVRYVENRVGILVPPRSLEKNCAYKYVNNLLSMNMRQWRLLPELNGQPVYSISLEIITAQNKRLEVHKDYDNNIYAVGIDDENVTGANTLYVKVRYVIPSDTKDTFIIQDIIASEMLQCPYKIVVDVAYDKYRIVELETDSSGNGSL